MSKGPQLEASLPVRFITAGTSGCVADLVAFPFDTVKVRLQIQGESSAHTTATLGGAAPTAPGATQYRGLFSSISTIVRQEGVRALYNGLSAGLQRQMCFSAIKFGAYDSTKAMYSRLLNENPDGLQVFCRIFAGLTTGSLAVICAQPTDVVKVRFQAQRKDVTGKARYTTTLQAYRTIGRDEGIRGLWKGALVNIFRTSIVNVSEIVCYDIIKDCLIKYASMKDNILCHFTGGLISGFATTVVASPIDVVKTRFMNSPSGQYTGALDCAIRMGRKEGLSAFYKGFKPSYARLALWNIVVWITYEQLKIMFFKPVNRDL